MHSFVLESNQNEQMQMVIHQKTPRSNIIVEWKHQKKLEGENGRSYKNHIHIIKWL